MNDERNDYLDVTEWLTEESKAEPMRWQPPVEGEAVEYSFEPASFTIAFTSPEEGFLKSYNSILEAQEALRPFYEALRGLVETMVDVQLTYEHLKRERNRHYFKLLMKLRKSRRSRFN